MKKKFLLSMCIALALMFGACGKKETNNEIVDTVGGNDLSGVEDIKNEEPEEKIEEEIEKNELILQMLSLNETATVKNNEITVTNSEPDSEVHVNVSIVFNDEVIDVGTSYPHYIPNYVIYDNDRLFVAVNMLQDGGYNIMHIYKLEGEQLIHTDEIFGTINSITEDEQLSLTTKVNVLGTYIVEGTYIMSDDGKFENAGVLNVINVDETKRLVFAKDYSTSENQYVAGDEILVLQIDPIEKIVYITVDDDKIDFITYEEDAEQKILIDGISEDELFSTIPYVE